MTTEFRPDGPLTVYSYSIDGPGGANSGKVMLQLVIGANYIRGTITEGNIRLVASRLAQIADELRDVQHLAGKDRPPEPTLNEAFARHQRLVRDAALASLAEISLQQYRDSGKMSQSDRDALSALYRSIFSDSASIRKVLDGR